MSYNFKALQTERREKRRHLPQPPIPAHLRDMLKDYPDHIRRLQELLDDMVYGGEPLYDPIDQVIEALKGRLGKFIMEAQGELQIAQASGDTNEISRAKEKADLMFDASSTGKGGGANTFYMNELWKYFEEHKDSLK